MTTLAHSEDVNFGKSVEDPAIIQWVEVHCTSIEIARFKECLMGWNEELVWKVEACLFSPLEAYPRFQSIMEDDVPCCNNHQRDGCDNSVVFDLLTREQHGVLHFTNAQYEQFVAIRRLMPEATLEPRVHKAVCNCGDLDCSEVVYRPSVLVTVEWHGYTLSREYSLST
jgi:hypothetical protein